MSKYVFHEITKGAKMAIIPPTIEEILDDNFNYPDYIKKYFLQGQNDDYLEKLLYREIPEDEIESRSILDDALVENGLLQNYENEIITIQNQYEDDLKNKKQTINYNEAMKRIAQKYYEILQNSYKGKTK